MKLAGDIAGGDVRERLNAVRTEHRAVVDVLGHGDADAARAAMRAHIDNSRKRLFG